MLESPGRILALARGGVSDPGTPSPDRKARAFDQNCNPCA